MKVLKLLCVSIILNLPMKTVGQGYKLIELYANDTTVILVSWLGELTLGTNLPSSVQGSGSFNYGDNDFFVLCDVSSSFFPDIDRINDIDGVKLVPLLNNHDFDLTVGKKNVYYGPGYDSWFKNLFASIGFTTFEANSVTNNNNTSLNHFLIGAGIMTGKPIKDADVKNAGFFFSANIYYSSFQTSNKRDLNVLFNKLEESDYKRNYFGFHSRCLLEFKNAGIFADFNYNFKRKNSIPDYVGKGFFSFGLITILNFKRS